MNIKVMPKVVVSRGTEQEELSKSLQYVPLKFIVVIGMKKAEASFSFICHLHF